ncbi:MAG: hypothetical protein Q8N04_06655 [Nitrospira sp.]|nr:hypothetical protein [Nitrospira sp.]
MKELVAEAKCTLHFPASEGYVWIKATTVQWIWHGAEFDNLECFPKQI